MKTTVEDVRREFQPGLAFKDGVEILKRWKSEGRAQAEVYEAMAEFHQELIAQHGHQSQEVELFEDLLDITWGWGRREHWIWDTSLGGGSDETDEVSPDSDGT